MPISYGHFEDQVIPCVESILHYEQRANIVVVDNGSPDPFPPLLEAKTIRIVPPGFAPLTAYSFVLASMMRWWGWDWAIFLNADVRCTGPFLETVRKLDPQQIYGNSLYEQNGTRWVDAWCFIISRQFWRRVGPPDNSFEIPGHFQDCDYCWQGLAAGFTCHETALPLVHLETKTGMARPHFWEERERNRQRVYKNYGFMIGGE